MKQEVYRSGSGGSRGGGGGGGRCNVFCSIERSS